LEPKEWNLGCAWVDCDLHWDHEHYPLLAWCLGPRGGRIPDRDLAGRIPDEGRLVSHRVILSAEAGPDARGIGGDTGLSPSPWRAAIYGCATRNSGRQEDACSNVQVQEEDTRTLTFIPICICIAARRFWETRVPSPQWFCRKAMLSLLKASSAAADRHGGGARG
jgi:hypothetical protein